MERKKADVHHRLAAMASPVAYIKELRQKMKHIDAFLISTEAWLLQFQWEDDVPHPRGRGRFQDPQWAAYMQQQIDIKNHSLVEPRSLLMCTGRGALEGMEIRCFRMKAVAQKTCAANKEDAT